MAERCWRGCPACSASWPAIRAAAKRIGKPVSRINYLVASADGWNAYFKGGQYFQGDKRGRIVRRIS